ncbi:hypothetical protein FACS1894216_12250 [Synergistales bacterium]|nr:hypothetical protein FACS1894216_12250 [Synergistales bacterium]
MSTLDTSLKESGGMTIIELSGKSGVNLIELKRVVEEAEKAL